MAIEEEDLRLVPTLPSEIVFEILIRLSVQSLLQCRSVCKSWNSLISDSHFVKSHLNFSTTNNHYVHHRLLFFTVPRKNLKSCPLYDVIYHKSFNPLELDYPLKHSNESIWIVGSCNGLLCIKGERSGLFIWNPSTRRSSMLPYCGFRSPYYSFGYDKSTDDYKIVSISCLSDKGKMYSLKSGNWKNIDGFPLGILCNNVCSKFLNGAIHWEALQNIGSSHLWPWIILSLDLAKETYSEVSQPMYDEGHERLTLGVLGEWLCVLCNYGIHNTDVWVMKVYRVKDSWTKLVSLHHPFGNVRDAIWRSPCIADGKILLRYGSKLVLYDPKKGSASKIKISDDCFQVHAFVESLVSPFAPPNC